MPPLLAAPFLHNSVQRMSLCLLRYPQYGWTFSLTRDMGSDAPASRHIPDDVILGVIRLLGVDSGDSGSLEFVAILLVR